MPMSRKRLLKKGTDPFGNKGVCPLFQQAGRRGSALLTVLWLSAALAAIAFSVSSSVRAETDRVEASSNGLRAWYLATGAGGRGIQWMFWGDAFPRADGTAYWIFNTPRMNMTFPSGTAVVEMI